MGFVEITDKLMDISVKSFITHKRGETDEDIQDSISIDLERGRFAVSDGVTNSFLPDILSRLLTRSYVAAANNDAFPSLSFPEQFKEERDRYMNSLDDEKQMLMEMVEEEFHVAGATFAGLTVNDNVFSWQVLGDSCLFIVPEDGRLRCFCSMPVRISPEWLLDVDFDNHPSQIHSDGKVYGEWTKGKRTITSGWIVLATDAVSAWFVDQHTEGNNPITQLWALNDNDEFEQFVENEYRAGRLKSDDESVVILNIGTPNECAEPNDQSDQSDLSDLSERPEL